MTRIDNACRFQVNTVKIPRLCLFSFLLLIISAPVAPVAAAEKEVSLMVKAGSCLISLANLYCRGREDWRRIARVNNLRAPYVIHEDTTLFVPAGLLLSDNIHAMIGAAHGEVRLSSAGMAPRPAKVGDRVPPGAMIETGEDGYALLIFPDQRFIAVEDDSRLRIKLALRLADGSIKVETMLERGSSLNSIKPGRRANDSFILRTPTVLTGVRGTEYRVKVEKKTRIETLRGEVYATAKGVRRTVSLGHGAVVGKKQVPSPPCPLPAPPEDFVTAKVYENQPLSLPLPKRPGKSTMRLTISRDEHHLHEVARHLGKAGESLSVTLPEDGLYFFTLTSINDQGFESPPTSPRAVVLRTASTAPILALPKSADFFTPSAPLPWASPRDVASYHVVVAKDPGFTEPLYETTAATPSWDTPDLPPGTYYAHMQSVDADGFPSAWSQTVTFAITEPAQLFDDRLTADEPVHLRWSAGQAGALYDLQVAARPDFSDLLVTAEGLRQPEYTLANQLRPGVYYLRVRSNMPGTPSSPWGAPQQITISPARMPMVGKIMGILGVLILCFIL